MADTIISITPLSAASSTGRHIAPRSSIAVFPSGPRILSRWMCAIHVHESQATRLGEVAIPQPLQIFLRSQAAGEVLIDEFARTRQFLFRSQELHRIGFDLHYLAERFVVD